MGYGFSLPDNDADAFALALSPFQSDIATSARVETEDAGLPDGGSTAAKHTLGRDDHLGKSKERRRY